MTHALSSVHFNQNINFIQPDTTLLTLPDEQNDRRLSYDVSQTPTKAERQAAREYVLKNPAFGSPGKTFHYNGRDYTFIKEDKGQMTFVESHEDKWHLYNLPFFNIPTGRPHYRVVNQSQFEVGPESQ
jgi:hypothetical protein